MNRLLRVLLGSALAILLFSTTLSQAERLSSGDDVSTYIDHHLKRSDVVVFAKTYCPYCKNTVRVLQELHSEMNGRWSLEIVQLDTLPANDGALIQNQLLAKTGQRTVPNVFIHHNHIGGNQQLMELHQADKLVPLLSA